MGRGAQAEVPQGGPWVAGWSGWSSAPSTKPGPCGSVPGSLGRQPAAAWMGGRGERGGVLVAHQCEDTGL